RNVRTGHYGGSNLFKGRQPLFGNANCDKCHDRHARLTEPASDKPRAAQGFESRRFITQLMTEIGRDEQRSKQNGCVLAEELRRLVPCASELKTKVTTRQLASFAEQSPCSSRLAE